MWYEDIQTPAYVIDEAKLIHNLTILKNIKERSGAHILLASKAFSTYHFFPLIGQYLDGCASSGVYEARLSKEEMGKEVHTFSPAYKEHEFEEIMKISDHIVFNSVSQWNVYKERIKKDISCGIRINPNYSEVVVDLYNPCREGSRFGITKEELQDMDLDGIEGLHFHTLCEQGVDTLLRTLFYVERDFKDVLHQMKWLNMGGGHHITKEGYDMEALISCIQHLRHTYDIEVYLEPGEAIALDAGWLVSSVLDVKGNALILDASAACHMPDVLEMPYRPRIVGSEQANRYPFTYHIGGNTCLAGDEIGTYSFLEEKRIGDRLLFEDMAIYTMVKNTTFNGVPLPAIYSYTTSGECLCIKQFGYEDFKGRLG